MTIYDIYDQLNILVCDVLGMTLKNQLFVVHVQTAWSNPTDSTSN